MSFFFALALAILLIPLARRVGVTTGLVDRPSQTGIKIHREPIPVLGGVAIVVSAFGALAAVRAWPALGVVVGIGIALGIGLLDDVRPLPPWLRTASLAVVGIAVAWGGFAAVPVFTLPGSTLTVVGIVLLVLACSNAVNLVDGQDGLAGGLACIAALGLAWLAALGDQPTAGNLSLALAGGLGGFLLWNRPPARIYLGNGGAYATGTILGALAAVIVARDGWHGLLAAGVCLGVFAFELAFTLVRRALSRSPVTVGDRLHSYDVLAMWIRSRARTTALFWGLGAFGAGLGVVVRDVPLVVAASLTAAACLGAAAFGALLWSRTVRGVRERT